MCSPKQSKRSIFSSQIYSNKNRKYVLVNLHSEVHFLSTNLLNVNVTRYYLPASDTVSCMSLDDLGDHCVLRFVCVRYSYPII